MSVVENVFQTVRQAVTVREAAERYGITVNRSGMACCPFHEDNNPSMKLNEDYFYCFGCGATGDVIDFTAKLFALSPKEAAEKLAQDFGLHYDSQAPPRHYIRQKTEVQKFKEDRNRAVCVLTGYVRLLRSWQTDHSPKSAAENLHPHFVQALREKDEIGYWLDFLTEADTEEQKVWLAAHQTEITNLERKLNIMVEQQSNKERLQQITAGIELGIKELFESDKYRRYLSVMSRFHSYSVNNTMLIYLQKPDATLVAGYHKWKDRFARHVKKGERGITIIAPTPYKKKIEEQKLDPDTKAPILDKDGRIVTEEKEIEIPMFRPVKVFDLSQTDGKPLPQLASSLSGNVPNYEVFIEALRRSAPVPLAFEAMAANTDGYFSSDRQYIAIREGMSEAQTVSAVVHEIAHSKLHNQKKIQIANDEQYQEIELFEKPGLFSNGRIARDNLPEGVCCYDLRGSDYDPGAPVCVEERVVVNHAGSVLLTEPLELAEDRRLMLTEEEGLNFTGGFSTLSRFLQEQRKDRHTEEVEAESISYAVCQYFGIETGENSFGYIAAWSKDKELNELRTSLESINKTAGTLISDIEHHYKQVCKERGLDLAVRPAQTDERRETQRQALDEYPMPDEQVSAPDMHQYGYSYDGMLPVTRERALELDAAGLTVYVLHEDNTESMVFDPQEIMDHGGLFGVDREEWEKSPQFHEKVMERQQHQQEREQAFLSQNRDCFAIYQVRENDPQRVRFMNLDWLQSHDISVNRSNYDLIYTAPLREPGTVPEQLEKLYEQFNLKKPADYHSSSMSVSDIVAIKQNGVVSYHYCDSVGFTQIPGFLPENPLKNAEMAVEDDYGMIDGIINNGAKEPTVAKLEQQARSGQPISLMDLSAAAHREKREKKKSVMEQLKSQPKAEHKKIAPKKSAEREI